MTKGQTFARFVAAPENRAALLAVQDLADELRSERPLRSPQPVYLHGPPGVGKTHLVAALAKSLARADSKLSVQTVSAADFLAVLPTAPPKPNQPDPFAELVDGAKTCDVLILEEVHHLPARAAEAAVQILDERQAHRLATVCT